MARQEATWVYEALSKYKSEGWYKKGLQTVQEDAQIWRIQGWKRVFPWKINVMKKPNGFERVKQSTSKTTQIPKEKLYTEGIDRLFPYL